MNISGITNTSFKGAYFVTGKGEDVRKVDDILKYGIVDKERISCDSYTLSDPYNYKQYCPIEVEGKAKVVGEGYSINTCPAFLLVVTGKEDGDAYREFTKKEKEYYLEETEKKPIGFSKSDYVNRVYEWCYNKCLYEGKTWINIIKDKCKFKKQPAVLDASNVLEAMKQNKFDYINGEIHTKPINIEDIKID